MKGPFPQPWPMEPAQLIRCDSEAVDTAHRLAELFREGAGERDRDRRLPVAEFNAFSQSGLGALTVPHAYGGPAVSNATLAEVIAILAAADASLGQLPQNQLAFYAMLAYLPDEQVKNWIYARALAGFRFSSTLSETHGKIAKDVSARIRRDGDEFVVCGRKGYSTAALLAHYVTVHVLDEDGRATRVVIPNTTAGLQVFDDWSSFGQRTTASGTMILNKVRVPANNVFETQSLTEKPTLYGPISQLIQAAIDAGIAREALRETVAFVRTRSRPWMDSGVERASDDPYIIAAVGDLAIKVKAADTMLHRAAMVVDESRGNESEKTVAASSIAVAEAKVLTTEAALLTSSKLFELAGTRSTLSEYMLDRHWRNARTHTLHDPVRWKYHAIGNYHLNGTAPPRHAWI
ncbi:MAG TPA: SfnB family sulfur acquisition oxidoreductase [Acetobacteraceae bacterium]|jgi:SfnB family sulfur acquisition oxidoreductase|nr:SfnB family sulfur acquisition oxidoreductase [Acetobacteraceae bacterium]